MWWMTWRAHARRFHMMTHSTREARVSSELQGAHSREQVSAPVPTGAPASDNTAPCTQPRRLGWHHRSLYGVTPSTKAGYIKNA